MAHRYHRLSLQKFPNIGNVIPAKEHIVPKFKIGDVIVNKEPKDRKYDRVVIGNSSNGQVVYEYRHPYDGKLLVGFFHEDGFVLKPTKKEGWINIYPHHRMVGSCGGLVFASEQEAQKFPSDNSIKRATIKIEWEE